MPGKQIRGNQTAVQSDHLDAYGPAIVEDRQAELRRGPQHRFWDVKAVK
jgi:hypothetical protein